MRRKLTLPDRARLANEKHQRIVKTSCNKDVEKVREKLRKKFRRIGVLCPAISSANHPMNVRGEFYYTEKPHPSSCKNPSYHDDEILFRYQYSNYSGQPGFYEILAVHRCPRCNRDLLTTSIDTTADLGPFLISCHKSPPCSCLTPISIPQKSWWQRWKR